MRQVTAPKHLKVDDDRGLVKCATCGFASQVIDSRAGPAGSIRRRRQCKGASCLARFTTYEVISVAPIVLDPGELVAMLDVRLQSIVFEIDQARQQLAAVRALLGPE